MAVVIECCVADQRCINFKMKTFFPKNSLKDRMPRRSNIPLPLDRVDSVQEPA